MPGSNLGIVRQRAHVCSPAKNVLPDRTARNQQDKAKLEQKVADTVSRATQGLAALQTSLSRSPMQLGSPCQWSRATGLMMRDGRSTPTSTSKIKAIYCTCMHVNNFSILNALLPNTNMAEPLLPVCERVRQTSGTVGSSTLLINYTRMLTDPDPQLLSLPAASHTPMRGLHPWPSVVGYLPPCNHDKSLLYRPVQVFWSMMDPVLAHSRNVSLDVASKAIARAQVTRMLECLVVRLKALQQLVRKGAGEGMEGREGEGARIGE